jgi:hypothetical protein
VDRESSYRTGGRYDQGAKEMNTNVGMNWIGVFFTAMAGINSMPDGHAKTILMSICMIASAIVAFATRGSGLSKSQGAEVLETSKELQDVLGEGREN